MLTWVFKKNSWFFIIIPAAQDATYLHSDTNIWVYRSGKHLVPQSCPFKFLLEFPLAVMTPTAKDRPD